MDRVLIRLAVVVSFVGMLFWTGFNRAEAAEWISVGNDGGVGFYFKNYKPPYSKTEWVAAKLVNNRSYNAEISFDVDISSGSQTDTKSGGQVCIRPGGTKSGESAGLWWATDFGKVTYVRFRNITVKQVKDCW